MAPPRRAKNAFEKLLFFQLVPTRSCCLSPFLKLIKVVRRIQQDFESNILEEKRERDARDDTGVIFDWIFFNRHLIMIWLEFYLSIRIFFLCSKLCQKSIKRFRTNQNQNLLLLLLLTWTSSYYQKLRNDFVLWSSL